MLGAILKSQDVQVQPKGALSLVSTATTYDQRNLCPQNKGWKWGQLQPSNVNSWEKISWQKKIKTTYCQLGFECAKMELNSFVPTIMYLNDEQLHWSHTSQKPPPKGIPPAFVNSELFKELVVPPSIQQMKLHYQTPTFLPSCCLKCHSQLWCG